jgi:D-tyrosyl-tRNA(Tyr) deacylase
LRLLLQRVAEASVEVEHRVLASIGQGLVVFVAVGEGDNQEDVEYLVDKVLKLRIFPDNGQHFNLSSLQIGAEILVVSQFTLYGDTRKGRRPSFTQAASPEVARSIFQDVVRLFRESNLKVEEGRFQEDMLVHIHNDGPVTVWLDSQDRRRSRKER